jgi:NAD+ synthase (glutamine-hydrolysing)
MFDYGYVRVGALVPELKVADVDFNVKEIIKSAILAYEKGVQILLTPELSQTS